nr:MAG: hypothetical protein AM325_16300 [Candidatus Thorarchaeota archaeon SMTZ1-45]
MQTRIVPCVRQKRKGRGEPSLHLKLETTIVSLDFAADNQVQRSFVIRRCKDSFSTQEISEAWKEST